jgi:hypothetical protein
LDVNRYKNILTAERAFTNRHLPRLWRPVLVLRLLARAGKHAFCTRDKSIASLMFLAALQQVVSIFDLTSGREMNRGDKSIVSRDESNTHHHDYK